MLKTGKQSWIVSLTGTCVCVAYLATSPALYFLASEPFIAEMVGLCPWTHTGTVYQLDQLESDAKFSPPPASTLADFPETKSQEKYGFHSDVKKNLPIFCELLGEKNEIQPLARVDPPPQKSTDQGPNFVLHTHTFTNNTHNKLLLWHLRLGHLNFDAVAKYLGLPQPQKPVFCPSCCKGKSTLLAAPKDPAYRATRIGQLIHSDLCGPIEVCTPSGKKYICIFVDDSVAGSLSDF